MPFPVTPLDLIERQAKAAAARGDSLNEACPYPFADPAGKAFRRFFNQHRDALAALGQAPTPKAST